MSSLDEQPVVFSPEIERKFFIKEIPFDLWSYPHEEIIQWYYKDPKDGAKKRIRQKGNTYEFAIKMGEGLIRQEWQKNISKKQFDELRKLVDKNFLKKTRYYIPYHNRIIELDIYKNLEWLMIAEIEFDNEYEASGFIPPARFNKELTGIKEAKNSYLAKYWKENLLHILSQTKKIPTPLDWLSSEASTFLN